MGTAWPQMDVERSQEFRKCIECYLCQDVCHVIRDHEENKTAYAGPRFFARAAELEMHPLDVNDRRELLQQEMGLGKCNITKCCTEVCPEHIKITDNAIIPLKERVVDASYDPVAWLGRKIRHRRKKTPAEAATTAPATGPAAVQPPTEVHGIPAPEGSEPMSSAEPAAQPRRRRKTGRRPRTGRANPRSTPPESPRLKNRRPGEAGEPAPEHAVARFLSPSWAEEFNRALEGAEVPGPDPEAGLAAADGTFTVVQEVRGGPDGDVRVILRVVDRALRLQVVGRQRRRRSRRSRGADGVDEPEVGDPDVTIVISYEDAVAMSKGELAPAEALNAGRIRVRGDLSVLVAAQQMLMAARASTHDLVSSTTY